MNARELLIETFPHIPPARALEALSPEDAARPVTGANHSIAELVAHMSFWQDWFVGRCTGVPTPMVSSAAHGWPAVDPGDWASIEERFVSGLERAAGLGDRLEQLVSPAIEFPPLSHYTVRDALVHVAQHNAHHLGQIILLRQMLGAWPPPSGSWTW